MNGVNPDLAVVPFERGAELISIGSPACSFPEGNENL